MELKKGIALIITALTVMTVVTVNNEASAESLFRAGVSESHYPIQPRSLYGSVRAKTVGDIITIYLNEQMQSTDKSDLQVTRDSTITDRFSQLINIFLPRGFKIPQEVNQFGGGQEVANNTQTERVVTFSDNIAAQVTQVLPNGNLVVQGKKATVNAGEKVNIIVSGIVDPRQLSTAGVIESKYVANLQVGMVGDGTVSRSNHEGIINKFVRFLF